MSADLKQEEKKRDSKVDLSKQFKERLIVDEKIPCAKCTLKQTKLVLYSCSHKLCFNCIFKFFISNGLKGLNTLSVKLVCPQCKKGNIEISLDDYIDILNQLLKTKDPNFDKAKEEEKENKKEEEKKEEERKEEEEEKKSVKKTDEANTDGNCKIHKEQKLIKHCNDCNVDLCEQCLESHNQGYPDHVLTDMIFEEKKEEKKEEEKKDNEKKEENKKTENNADKRDPISDEIYNKEMNDIKQKEKKFLQKLENESNNLSTKINQLINDLNAFLENYNSKMDVFKNNMTKIFEIFNLTYYNYYKSNDTDKYEIIKKELIDFNALLKRVNLNEMSFSLKKISKDFNTEQQVFNFELQWDGEEYKQKYELRPKKGDPDNADCVTRIIELKNLNKIVSGLINGKIYVWDLSTKIIDYSIKAHKSAIWSMIKLSNDYIVSGSSDKTIKIWDVVNGKSDPTIELTGHKGTVFCLGEFEKNKLLSGGEDRTIKLWDLVGKNCIMTLKAPNNCKINSFYIMPDPGFIIIGGDDNLLKIWNIYSDYVPKTLKGHACTIWSIISIGDDDTKIASGSSDNTIKIWDLTKSKCIFTLEGHDNTISSLKILNNDLLISTSWDKSIKLWDLKARNCVSTIIGHNDIVWDVIQLSDGDLASCSNDKKIIVWTKNNLNTN